MKPPKDRSREIMLEVARDQIRERATKYGLPLAKAAAEIEAICRAAGQPEEMVAIYREALDAEKKEES